MKKMLMLIMFLVFMLSVSIEVNALTCEYNEYNKDGNGMVLRLSKGSNNDVGWQLDKGDSSYSRFQFEFASNSKLLTMTNCPSVIYYGCDGRSATCTISENNNIYSNTIKGELTLKTGSSNVGGGSTGNSNTKPNYDLGIFGGVTGNETCPAIFGSASDPDSIFGFMSKYIFTPIRWLTPIILIVLTSLDFAKAIFVDEKDGMGKAKSNFGKRAVAALIIFLAPTIVSILLTLIDGANVSECMKNAEIGNL